MTTGIRRPRSITPEERAQRLSESGYMASGNSYISVVMRSDLKPGKVPYYENPDKCDHSWSMCPNWSCIESWSLDYKVLLPNTGAGRRLAKTLNIDPAKFALGDHEGLEFWNIEDYRPES